MIVGVVQFPGSNCDQDCLHAWREVLGLETEYIWHRDTSLHDSLRAVVLPGGFTYGDYLRVGAIARIAPIMQAVRDFAARGGLVIGICNGFQILTETGLLPGALIKNAGLRFICRTVPLSVEKHCAPWTDFEAERLEIPIAHGQGNYYIDPDGLKRLEDNGQVLFRYADENPNGSVGAIAGITNEAGNVLGMMPHPERRAEAEMGGRDGLLLLESMRRALL